MLKKVKKALGQITNNKAPRLGNLPIKLLMHASTGTLEIICTLFMLKRKKFQQIGNLTHKSDLKTRHQKRMKLL